MIICSRDKVYVKDESGASSTTNPSFSPPTKRVASLLDLKLPSHRSVTHHLPSPPALFLQVFKEFVSHTQYEAGKPTFGMLLCLIVYLVELCRRFLDNDRGNEIPSIHNTATRLMLDAEHQLSPANWVSRRGPHF